MCHIKIRGAFKTCCNFCSRLRRSNLVVNKEDVNRFNRSDINHRHKKWFCYNIVSCCNLFHDIYSLHTKVRHFWLRNPLLWVCRANGIIGPWSSILSLCQTLCPVWRHQVAWIPSWFVACSIYMICFIE